MKSISGLSLLFLFVFLVSCSEATNDLYRKGLKGQVKSVREIHCNPTHEDEKWVASADCDSDTRVVEYDAEGNYTQSYSLSDSQDTTSLAVARRENGELVEEIFYSRRYMTPKHSEMVAVSRTMMDRVSDDQVNFEVWQNDQLRFEGATYYDSKGRVERQVQVVNDREVMLHHVYEKDLLVEVYQMELDGTRSATQLYDYDGFDENGNWTLRMVYTGKDKISPEIAITRELEYY